ncbi:orphan sodium- and chloride-dependent neurotransmitter transporter NTT5-like [Sorex fumeus]|uniref:orphan sodium- and chloride-dependent neurotransmitter transporter NTT5-like n=1 Tax=Sorex fumeus TaxID=62283 RepID=UPI0024AE688C|nr:orphan sodium- and chloride-dependent neurotransmitter transporter NTT5-like [Sorex fumeus]
MLRSLDSKSSAFKISENCKSSESVHSDQKWSSLHSYIWNDENRTQETIATPTRPIRKFSSTRTCWSNKTEFLLASVGFSVGLSNVWHFPRLCFNNGGGTFLLIYIFLMFLFGVPLLFLEMGIGQRMGLGSTGAWKNISPWIAGLGYSNFMVCCIVGSYYSALVAWCVYYLFHSFHFPLPWTLCPILKNSSDPDPECMRTSPSKYFWYRHVLKASDKIKIGGLPDDHLTLCLFGTWFIVGLSLMNGLKSTSKVLYVSVLLPYILLFGFLVRNVQLEGASFGIMILLDAKMSVLYSLDMWHQTVKQILFSLGSGFGSYVAISSYMPRSNNCISDAFAVVIFNLIFSVVATVVIFALMGHMATENIKECYQSIIDGFSKPSIVAILVCFLLLNVGLSTLIGIMQGIVTPIQDTLPGPWKQTKWLTVSICMTMFLGSLTFMTPSGSYLVNLLDEHWLPLPLFGIITLEIVAITWLYGSRRFLADMITIMNRPTWPIYRWLWSYVILLLLLIQILKILSQMPMLNITYLAWNSSTSKEVIRKYPPWAKQLCTSMIIFTFLPLPVYFLYHSFQVPPPGARQPPTPRSRADRSPPDSSRGGGG